MSKKLTTTKLNTAAKKLYAMQKVVLTDVNGEEWEVGIDKNMSPNKVEDMGKDLTLFLARLKEENIEAEPDIMDAVSENIYGFVIVYIIKYFTDVPVEEGENTKETVLQYVNFLNNLYNMGLIDTLIKQFNETAFTRTIEDLSTYITTLDNNLKMLHEKKVEHNENEHVEVEQVE